ncbi:hypothetical protein AB0P45_30235, partial [Streptomyces niveus]|uniref:hypothetical protein n=1 Tax=Streptomyces niveus TaxID=193462 RepID=UPI00343961C9
MIDRLIGDYAKAVAASTGDRGLLELDRQESVPAAREEWGGEAESLVGDSVEIEVLPIALNSASLLRHARGRAHRPSPRMRR